MIIPHCPNAHCFIAPSPKNWFVHYGSHHTETFGEVPRFQCKLCKRTFSTQTFSIDYYAKKLVNSGLILQHLITASGLMDVARPLSVRPETIQNRYERLARTTLAIHSDLMKSLPMNENIVADGFETFSLSQFFPNHITFFAGGISKVHLHPGLRQPQTAWKDD